MTYYVNLLSSLTYDSSPVHTYPDSFVSANIFCGCALLPHVSGEKAHRDRKLLKTVSRVKRNESRDVRTDQANNAFKHLF